MTSILKKAIETYGADMQLNVAVEEFAELTKEICKHKRGRDNTEAIIEEMADCYIMLEQMQMIFGIDITAIVDVVNTKVKRLEKRLGCNAIKPKHKTNFDRITSSVDALAEFVSKSDSCPFQYTDDVLCYEEGCKGCIKEWLQRGGEG